MAQLFLASGITSGEGTAAKVVVGIVPTLRRAGVGSAIFLVLLREILDNELLSNGGQRSVDRAPKLGRLDLLGLAVLAKLQAFDLMVDGTGIEPVTPAV